MGLGWTEYQDEDADIHFALTDSTLAGGLTGEQKLNDDSLGAPSTDPAIAATSDWWNMVVFVDQRRDAGDIYLQVVANNGQMPDGNVRVNADDGFALQSEPAVARAGDKALVVWVDGRAVAGVSGQRIYGRFSSVGGSFTGSEFIISDPAEAAIKYNPVAAVEAGGRGMVAWVDCRQGSPQVYGRWLTVAGSLLGDEFLISDGESDGYNIDLHLGLNAMGEFLAVWLDRGGASPTVKGKRFSSDGQILGSFAWTSTLSGVTIDDIAAAVEPGGNLHLLWTGTNGVVGLFFTVIDRDGQVLQAPLAVTDNPTSIPSDPALSVDNSGYSSAVWVDGQSRRVMYQIYDNVLNRLGENQPVSPVAPEIMQSPAVCAYRGLAWFAWVDCRANGLNVYAGNRLYLPTGVNEDPAETLPHAFALRQNCPNPFNPSTRITFDIPHKTSLTLTVFNVLGRRVLTLADGVFEAGSHAATWNGTDAGGSAVASGVYFYRLETPTQSGTKKMLFLK
ncbi:MAG: T9SS type A sorting domain-containing protein [candidate division Zixibacteria bacterium]|nr:T9SS type A sorting domain-containing protein [candidate division Zixibacteria bacterium]